MKRKREREREKIQQKTKPGLIIVPKLVSYRKREQRHYDRCEKEGQSWIGALCCVEDYGMKVLQPYVFIYVMGLRNY